MHVKIKYPVLVEAKAPNMRNLKYLYGTDTTIVSGNDSVTEYSFPLMINEKTGNKNIQFRMYKDELYKPFPLPQEQTLNLLSYNANNPYINLLQKKILDVKELYIYDTNKGIPALKNIEQFGTQFMIVFNSAFKSFDFHENSPRLREVDERQINTWRHHIEQYVKNNFIFFDNKVWKKTAEPFYYVELNDQKKTARISIRSNITEILKKGNNEYYSIFSLDKREHLKSFIEDRLNYKDTYFPDMEINPSYNISLKAELYNMISVKKALISFIEKKSSVYNIKFMPSAILHAYASVKDITDNDINSFLEGDNHKLFNDICHYIEEINPVINNNIGKKSIISELKQLIFHMKNNVILWESKDIEVDNIFNM